MRLSFVLLKGLFKQEIGYKNHAVIAATGCAVVNRLTGCPYRSRLMNDVMHIGLFAVIGITTLFAFYLLLRGLCILEALYPEIHEVIMFIITMALLVVGVIIIGALVGKLFI